MCVCVCLIFNISNLDNLQTAWDIDMKIGTPVKQLQPFNCDYFMIINARFVVLWNFKFFENFLKIV